MGNFYSKFVRSGILFLFRDGNPKVAFDDEEPPPAPDYTTTEAWGALPDKDGPHNFPVVLNVVVVCDRENIATAAVVKAVVENTVCTHRIGLGGILRNGHVVAESCLGAAVGKPLVPVVSNHDDAC